MKVAKLFLILVALLLGAFVALAAIGFIVTAVQYLFWLAVICIVGAVAVKLLTKADARQLESKSAYKELEKADRLLEEYKRKQDRR